MLNTAGGEHPKGLTSCCPGGNPSSSSTATCCNPTKMTGPAPAPAPMAELLQGQHLGSDHEAVKQHVQQYYGKELTGSKDLKTGACAAGKAPSAEIRALLAKVPQEIKDRFYGCGTPLPQGVKGLRVLDLGCGAGRDCYIAAAMVGEEGMVTGVDMTAEQLEVAERHVGTYTTQVLGYAKPNMRFVKGAIEKLDGIEDGSQDLVISNCVINLCPDKAAVLREAYRVLAPGGEMFFSDMYCDRRLPKEVRMVPVMVGEGLGGALYINDFLRLAREVGFTDPRSLDTAIIPIYDAELAEAVGDAKFYSITYRLFKLPGRLETLCEDYGQVAVYKGTLPGHKAAYALDDHHRFVAHKPMLVCGNTAAMVEETWLRPHFVVTGNRDVHYGQFDCSGPVPSAPQAAAPAGACAPGGGCC